MISNNPLITDVSKIESQVSLLESTKQDKLTGQSGQLISIGDDGKAKATAYLCNKNLLLNWYFANPVNRKGLGQYSAAGYSIDRWYIRSSGTTLELVEDGIKFVVTEDGVSYPYLNQRITGLDLLGKTVTVSAIVESNWRARVTIASANGVSANSTAVVATTYSIVNGLITATAKIPTSINHSGFTFGIILEGQGANIPAGSYIKVKAVKIEIGSHQTLAHEENGQWVLNEIPNYAEQYAICEQYSPITGEFVGGRYSNENLLDNWYFADPVNRNGRTEYTAVEYAIDRWRKTSTEANGVLLVEKTGLIAKSGSPVIRQYFEDKPAYVGKTLTASILFDNNELLAATQTVTAETFRALYTSNLYFDSNASENEVFAVAVPADRHVIAAKLELGSVQTLAHQNEDGSWVLNEIPNYAEQYAICSQYSPITGEFVGSQHSNPNLLDNWYFVNPINQGGQTEYTGSGYTIDRWRGATNLTVRLTEDGISLVPSSNSNVTLDSFFEKGTDFYGKTFTLSTLTAENELYFLTTTFPETTPSIEFSQSTKTLFGAIQLRALTDGRIRILISCTASSVTVVAAKLELGPIQTLAHKDENGQWVLNEIPNYAEQYAICSQYDFITDKFIGRQHSNQNLLDNWYFLTPINQRGETSYTGNNIYTIDRWRTTSGNGSIVVTDQGIKITAVDPEYYYFAQDYENSSELLGKTLTFSILLADGNLYSVTGTALSSVPSETTEFASLNFESGKLSIFVTFPGYVRTRIRSNHEITVVAAKLELGSAQTLAHKEGSIWVLNDPLSNPALELMKCQRYYVKYPNRIVVPGQLSGEMRHYYMSVVTPTSMRAIPSVSMSGWIGRNSRGYSKLTPGPYELISPTSITVTAISQNMILLHDSIEEAVDEVNNEPMTFEIYDLVLDANL